MIRNLKNVIIVKTVITSHLSILQLLHVHSYVSLTKSIAKKCDKMTNKTTQYDQTSDHFTKRAKPVIKRAYVERKLSLFFLADGSVHANQHAICISTFHEVILADNHRQKIR